MLAQVQWKRPIIRISHAYKRLHFSHTNQCGSSHRLPLQYQSTILMQRPSSSSATTGRSNSAVERQRAKQAIARFKMRLEVQSRKWTGSTKQKASQEDRRH